MNINQFSNIFLPPKPEKRVFLGLGAPNPLTQGRSCTTDSGGVFVATSDLNFLVLHEESQSWGRGHSWFAKNRVILGFLAQNLLAQTRSCITETVKGSISLLLLVKQVNWSPSPNFVVLRFWQVNVDPGVQSAFLQRPHVVCDATDAILFPVFLGIYT